MVPVASVADNKQQRKEVFAKVDIRLPGRNDRVRRILNMKVDTGAMGSTLPLRMFRQIMPERTNADGTPDKRQVTQVKNTTLIAYNNTKIDCYGTIDLHCKYRDTDWAERKFYIVDVPGPAVCGLPMAEALGLVTIHCSVEMPTCKVTVVKSLEDLKRIYGNQFDRIGNLPGKVKIMLKEGAIPFIDPPRKYSIHMKPKLQAELAKMENQGIIAKVTEHSDWCSSLVTSIKKDGSIQICLDPKKLNEALRRCPHKTLTLEEISHRFHGAKFFSKLDAKAGYWSVELEEESQLLTTFRTPFGRYKFRRLPFGLCVSQDYFQQKIDQIIENCPGTVGIADDIACFAASEAEHDRNLLNLMEEAKKNGLVFNSDKCVIKQPQIEYFGMVFSANGMKPDQAKVVDLQAMPAPTSKTELQEFLGLITYLSPFIRNLSAQAEPIRKLLCKDTPFQWSEDHQHVFDHLKTLVSTEACLKYYDTEAPTYLMVDASQRGLGAALLQPDRLQNGNYTVDTRPVAFASKSLSKSQQNYVNIEREMLAITFGIKRLHTYLYNRPFVVLSDHKPLEMICNKPLMAAPPRLQAMLLAVQDYDFRVRYVPGKDVGLADALSRLPNQNNREDVRLDMRIEHIQFAEDKLKDIRTATGNDPVLNELKETIYAGWPETQKELPDELRNFWSYRDELSLDGGLILKGERILIPEPHRAGVLRNLHTGHLGIIKTQLRAKKDVYWPKINEDIEKMCKACSICQRHQRSQISEPLQQTEIPSHPWSVVASDIFQIGQDQYLLTVDYYTKFPLVDKLPKPATSQTVSAILRRYCGILGIPDIMRTDNGPHYSGRAFAEFRAEIGFRHVTSSPRYPQSNGFIERQVATVKAVLTKAREANEDQDLALLRLRTTPISSKLPSPAELLFQRRVKDTLPAKITNTDPAHDDICREFRERQIAQKTYHDKKSRRLPPLLPGQKALYQDERSGKWTPAIIRARAPEPRSYIISTPSAQTLRRNRVQLRSSSDQPEASGKSQKLPTCTPGANLTATPHQPMSSKKDHTNVQSVPATRSNGSDNQHRAEQPATPRSSGGDEGTAKRVSVDAPTRLNVTSRVGRLIKRPARYQ